MNERDIAPTRSNLSSDKLLTIVETLAEQAEPIRLQDLAKLCDMNTSTTLRFLTALRSRNYVAQEIDTGRYYLTFKICALAEKVSSSLDVRNIALPFMRSVANIFAESCNLAIESDMTILYVEVANSPQKTLMTTQRIGNVAPMHCTGIGKLMLSEYGPAELDHYCQVKGLPRYTEYTITEKGKLMEELEQISTLGYAFDNQECEIGARCIAVPIRDYTGKIIAGLSVSGPMVRMTNEHIYDHLQYLLENSRQISVHMGWHPGDP